MVGSMPSDGMHTGLHLPRYFSWPCLVCHTPKLSPLSCCWFLSGVSLGPFSSPGRSLPRPLRCQQKLPGLFSLPAQSRTNSIKRPFWLPEHLQHGTVVTKEKIHTACKVNSSSSPTYTLTIPGLSIMKSMFPTWDL